MNTSTNIDLTCWQGIVNEVRPEEKEFAKKAAVVVLCLVTLVNIICNTWCVIVTFTKAKLRKPTWILKASMAIKDIIFCVSTTAYAIWNVASNSEHLVLESKRYFQVIEFIFNVVYMTCISSSFFHILLVCFDRQQVIYRPFRYHTGELLPSKVCCILIGSCWTFCFVIGLSVASQSLETAENERSLVYAGSFFPFYQLPGLQKWLLGGGMAILYFITFGLLLHSLAIEFNRAKIRKARLISGLGDPEPLRSRNNSVCYVGKRAHSIGVEESGANSEADANEFLLRGGLDFTGLGAMPERMNDPHPEGYIFTPVNYRPSLLRRIRDTWSLYAASFCFVAFTLLCAIPFLVIVLVGMPEKTLFRVGYGQPRSYCIAIMVLEYMPLLQGIAYITIYLIVDDVFRPYFLRPIQYFKRKQENELIIRGHQHRKHGEILNQRSAQSMPRTAHNAL